jgi:DNA-binding phage protein
MEVGMKAATAEVIRLPYNVSRQDKQFREAFNYIVAELQSYNLQSVAEAAGVKDQTLYNWINRTVKFPSTRTFFRVATAMGYVITLEKLNG